MSQYTRQDVLRALNLIAGEKLPGRPAQEYWQQSVAQNYAIGSRKVDSMGRVFKYTHVNDGTYGPTNAPTQVRRAYGVSSVVWAGTIETSVAAANAALGARQVSYTTIGAFPANHYQGGLLVLEGGAGYGFQYRIKSHGVSAGAAATVVFTLEEPLLVAVTAADPITLYRSPYAEVESPRQGAIEAIGAVNLGRQSFLGVPLVDALAGTFFWLMTHGPALVVSGSGAEGTNMDERQLVWDRDGSVELAAIDYAAPQSRQHAGYILPATNSALTLPAVGVPGGPGGMMYMMVECDV